MPGETEESCVFHSRFSAKKSWRLPPFNYPISDTTALPSSPFIVSFPLIGSRRPFLSESTGNCHFSMIQLSACHYPPLSLSLSLSFPPAFYLMSVSFLLLFFIHLLCPRTRLPASLFPTSYSPIMCYHDTFACFLPPTWCLFLGRSTQVFLLNFSRMCFLYTRFSL